jgi:predicted nucleic acid-binding protein
MAPSTWSCSRTSSATGDDVRAVPEVQGDLTALGQHRGAGPVDLVVAATAELFGLTLLHHDRDFATIAGVTGQALRWYGPD